MVSAIIGFNSRDGAIDRPKKNAKATPYPSFNSRDGAIDRGLPEDVVGWIDKCQFQRWCD